MKRLIVLSIFVAMYTGAISAPGWYTFFKDHGLPSDKITCLSNEANGEFWVGTDNGLANFNSWNYTIYNTSSGLKGNNIAVLYAVPGGGVWVGYGSSGQEGLSLVEAGLVTNFNLPLTSGSSKIDYIAPGNGGVYFASADALYFRDQNGFSIIALPPFSVDIVGCSEYINGTVLVGTNKGVFQFDGANWSSIYEGNVLYKRSYSNEDGDIVIEALPENKIFFEDNWLDLSNDEIVRTSIIFGFEKSDNGDEFIANSNPVSRLFSYQNGAWQISASALNGYYNSNINALSKWDDYFIMGTDSGLVFMNMDAKNQESETMEVNTLKFPVHSNGQIGVSLDDNSGMFDGINSLLYLSNLWVYGESGPDEFVSAEWYYTEDEGSVKERQFFAGPIAAEYDKPYNNRVWKVTKAQIDNHIANYSDPAYVMPDVIRRWPAHGNTQYGEADCLAPFVDVDQDGFYKAENGDYPFMEGDEAIYAIYNDEQGPRGLFGTEKSMGLEIHMMMYGYSTEPDLENTLFVKYKIINRSTENYENVHVALWNDMDIGNPSDDYLGCDTTLQLFYTFNGSFYDADFNDYIGFGIDPPALGVTFLNSSLNSFSLLANSFSPNPLLIRDVMLRDRATLGDDAFMFWGDPVAHTGWTEQGSGFLPGDRKSIGVAGSFNLPTGEALDIHMAYVYARDTANAYPASIDSLRQSVQSVRQFYNNNSVNWPVSVCTSAPPTGIRNVDVSESELQVYPNPANSYLNISVVSGMRAIQVTDLQGRTVWRQKLSGQTVESIDVAFLSTGVYLLKVTTPQGVYTQKFIKE